jgi:hypothetical protein
LAKPWFHQIVDHHQSSNSDQHCLCCSSNKLMAAALASRIFKTHMSSSCCHHRLLLIAMIKSCCNISTILSCELQKMGQTPRSWWNCAKGICHVKTWSFICRPTVLASSWGFFVRLSLQLLLRHLSGYQSGYSAIYWAVTDFFSIRKNLITAWYWVFKKSINLATWMTWSSFQLQAGYSIVNHLLIQKKIKQKKIKYIFFLKTNITG